MQLKRSLFYLAAAPLLFLCGYFANRHGNAVPMRPAAALAAPAQAQALGGERAALRFAPGAPQLQFIATEQAVQLPEPLIEPLNGRVVYDEDHTSRVSTPIAGRVVKIGVQLGDTVGAGSALAWLDAPDYAAAAADGAKSASEVLQKTRAYARSRELYDAGVIARKDYEAAEADLSQAQAELHRARLRMRSLDGGGATARDDGRYALRAPIGGVVADRQLNPGAEARPDAAAPLFIITDPRHVWVMIDLPERYLSKVHVGQTVSVEVDAYKGLDVNGRIASIGQVLDPATRRVPVRCVVDNPHGLLKPEMYARVVPLAEERKKRVRIPNSALVSEGVYSFVFVETQPGGFERRRVTLGLQGRDTSYVTGGVAAGERVVTSGAMLLQSEAAGAR